MVGPPVGQPVDQPRVAVVGEDDRPVGREERVELAVGQAVRVLRLRLEPHQVDDVDDADLAGRAGRWRRRSTAASVSSVGMSPAQASTTSGSPPSSLLAQSQMPMPRVQWRIASSIDEPVRRGLLAGDDHVDVVAAAQAVVGDREQRVRVRRQVDPDDLGLLVDDVVDEARVLVAEAVVVLAPDVRAQQVVERGDRAPPGDVGGHLQPLRVLVEHRVDDVDERLVAVEEAVPAGQQVALQPALALVLGEDLHHPAVRGEVVVGREDLGHPGLVGHLEDGAEAVRGGLVRAEDAEVLAVRGP